MEIFYLAAHRNTVKFQTGSEFVLTLSNVEDSVNIFQKLCLLVHSHLFGSEFLNTFAASMNLLDNAFVLDHTKSRRHF